MRTSNKILLVAALLFVASMVTYDFSLKAEYQKGDYKDPFRKFVSLDLKDFNAIDLEASTAVNIMLVKGPYKVLIEPSAQEFVHIDQNANTLKISAGFKYGYEQNNRAAYLIYISCPNITRLKTDARYHYMSGQKERTDTLASPFFNYKPTIISGFDQDSLQVIEDHASNVIIQNSRIGYLHVVSGGSEGSASNLTIGTNNEIKNSDLDIRNNSRLWIKDATKAKLGYRLADSAQLILNGHAQNQLIK